MDIYDFIAVGILGLMLLLVTSGLYLMAKFAGVSLVDWRAIRRLRRNPRFGVLGIMAATAAVAIDLTLMQALGIDLLRPSAACFGVSLFLFAVAIIGFIFVSVDDFAPSRRRRELLRNARHGSGTPPPSSATSNELDDGASEQGNRAIVHDRGDDLQVKDDPGP